MAKNITGEYCFPSQVISDGDVELSQSRVVERQDLIDFVEGVEGDNRDDSHFIVILLLGESSDVLDDCGLQQLIENDPVKFGTALEGESVTEFEKVTAGRITESVTFLDNVVEVEKGNKTSKPVRAAVWWVVNAKLPEPRLDQACREEAQIESPLNSWRRNFCCFWSKAAVFA